MIDIIFPLLWLAGPALSYYFYSWFGLAFSIVIIYFLVYILPTYFGLFSMPAFDALLLFESPTNSLAVTSFFIFSDKITLEEFKKCFIKALPKEPRLKQKLVNIFGRYYFKNDPEFNLDSHFILHPEPILKADLEQYVSNVCSKPLNFNRALYEFHVFENFEEGSAIVFRFHHSLSDGVSVLNMITWCADEGTCKHLYVPKGLSQFKQFLVLLTSFFTCFYFLAKLLMKTPDKNSLRVDQLSGKKSISWSDKIKLKGIFRHCKEKNITFNDLLTALVLESLEEYAGSSIGSVTMNVPVSLIKQPKDGSFMQFENHLIVVTMNFPPVSSNLIQDCSKVFNELKSSIEPYVSYYTSKLTMALFPRFFMKHLVFYIVNKSTLLFSNAGGPREPIFYSGKKFDRFLSMSPNMANCGISVTALSYMDHFSIICYADKSTINDTQRYIRIISDKLAKINGKYLD